MPLLFSQKGGGNLKLFSSYKTRFNKTPASTGEWLGERAESIFIPNNPASKEALENFGEVGVNYQSGKLSMVLLSEYPMAKLLKSDTKILFSNLTT